MTPHLDSKIKPKNDMTAKQLVSHTIFAFGNVALVVAGSLNGPTAELFRTFQDVIVPERPAVRCSTQGRRQQCHPKQVPLTRRVGRLQSHRFSSTNERTMQADFCCSRAPQAVLQGAPLDCSNRTHCSAAWSMASAGYLQPLSDRQYRPGKPPDIRHPRNKQNRQKRIRVISPPPEEERDKGRETEKGAPGGAKILQALVTLVSTAFSLPN